MRFAAGERLGPYEVLATVGAGGMGEVYRARDLRLGRDVALKILPAAFARDPDRLQRFEGEARAAAALNHPNILAVYDIGQHDGSPFIVSELLEGETLRARLQEAGPGGLQRKTLQCALDVAHGLAAAHEKGIVHRDLKPENIFLTSDGHAKILDFGLAKLSRGAAARNAPTLALETQPGLIMGTAGYMSPEQVRGEPADHRSDIFAFGAILYEMLSGRMAFARPGGPETFAAILHDEVASLSDMHPNVAPGIARLVERCLEKKPGARFQSTRDLAFALEDLAAPSGKTWQPAVAAPRRPSWRSPLVAAAAAVALIVATAFVLSYLRDEETGRLPVRFQVTPPGTVSYTATASFVEVSPDGDRLAMSATTKTGTSMIWIRPLDSLAFEPVAGTERGTQPFWSSDGASLGFFADGRVKRVTLGGGAVQTVCSVSQQGTGGAWQRDGTILISSIRGPIMRVAASGGTPEPVTVLNASAGEHTHLFPVFLPDDRRFLYYALSSDSAKSGIYVKSLDSNDPRLVVPGGSRFAYASAGYLVYARDGSLVAHPFDLDTATVTGDPVPTRERVDQYAETGNATFSLSPDGVLAHRSSVEAANSRLVWVDRAGAQLHAIGEPANYRNPRISPDETRIAVEVVDSSGNRDVAIVDVARGGRTRFTFDAGRDASPVWLDGGRRIAWQGPDRVYVKDASGAGREEVLHSEPWIPDDSAPDGSGLLMHPGQPRHVWLLPLTGTNRNAIPIIEGRSITTHARVSFDGKWVAYATNDSGRFEVWVQAFPSAIGKWPVSIDGGLQPKWRRDGKELFYIAPNGFLMAVPLGYGRGVEPGTPVALFAMGAETTTGSFWHQYDVTPDGKRFLVNTRVDGSPGTLTVVVDWPAVVNR